MLLQEFEAQAVIVNPRDLALVGDPVSLVNEKNASGYAGRFQVANHVGAKLGNVDDCAIHALRAEAEGEFASFAMTSRRAVRCSWQGAGTRGLSKVRSVHGVEPRSYAITAVINEG
jgi:hypothetical protein